MINKEAKKVSRQKRHLRIRSKISGTQERPRLCVFRSDKHIYAQLIDDVNGVTLAQASTLDKSLKLERTSNTEAAKAVGTKIGELAKEKGIEEVVFDRAGYIYHGRIKELAEAARSAGLKF